MSDETIAIKPAQLTCGLIMPISQLENLPPAHWDEVKEIITKTVEGISEPSFTARLVSEGDDAGVIHKRIIQNVYTDDIAICDVSGRNPNVMFELGMRLAFDKPTVIIKDDDTPRIFDTDVIEYVSYRRDLRYAAMEGFKAKLANKVVSTYALSKNAPEKSFLKSFGTFKVVKLDEASESPDKAILSLLNNMDRKISRIQNETSGFFQTRVSSEDRVTASLLNQLSQIIDDYKSDNPEFSVHTAAAQPLSDPKFTKMARSKIPDMSTRVYREALATIALHTKQ